MRPYRSRLGLLWLWVIVVVLYFSWEAASYRGLFALIAEWQFAHIGQDLPTFTFGLLTTIFAWPALHIFRRRPRRRRRRSRRANAPVVTQEQLEAEENEAAISAARDYMHFLSGFTSSLLLAAIIALLWTLMLPTFGGPVQDVRVDRESVREGPAQLVGTLRYGRIASFSRGILFIRRSELYAPILPTRSTGGVRYFAEFLPAEQGEISSGSTLTHRTGILVQSDLPGPLIRLYRYLGYRIEPGYHVLYASALTIRWPYYMIAAQFALGAIGFLVAALMQRRHLRQMARVYDLWRKGRFFPDNGDLSSDPPLRAEPREVAHAAVSPDSGKPH